MKDKISYKLILVAVFVLFVTTLIIVETYALFETDATGESDFDIGRWIIYLNNNDVKLTRTISLNNFVYVNGSHTQNGYFAPGSQAYFDLVIDASNSDVSVAYDLEIDDTSLTDYPNIYFTVTDLSTNQPVVGSTYNGLIRLSDVSKVDTLRINLVWDNQLQYDETDTSLIGEELEFVITANFVQSIAE